VSADRFAEVERLYHEASIRRPEERAAFLDQACGGDDALRRDVESLLSFQTDADEFLSRPAVEEAARTNTRPWEPDSWPTIPGYTVQRVLGEGGMGVVYLAEQQTPLRRLVALKLIKPGMDTRQVVTRFETERQALALMDHPNIAAVFDAGSTSEGRPYFVMEYVDGVSITEYCDRGRLSTRDRLALFVQVCAAVQHAHQKGVIHRDLKPSNVLVTERDGHPLPKVIDFGTAKAVGATWNGTATQGGQGMVLGTLEYMSPEQAALSADIDTATDVYSLGVLLYELLVGRLPFDTDELRAAGYDEIRRVIRESDPPKPSVRVERRSDKSGAAARARQTDAPGLTRQLRGDLDWIALKALEKDRTRRYATVAAFATDIGRFLDDEPVEARPPSSTYRIRKFTRRHRLAVAAAAIIVTILSGAVAANAGLYLYWQAQGARREAAHQGQLAREQREQALVQANAAAEANELREEAVVAQASAESQRQNAMSAAATARAALKESNYLADVANLAAAAGDLRTGAAAEARARLLTVQDPQRGWEWQHLFMQTDESVFNFSSAVTPCRQPRFSIDTTALRLDADGESILLRRCLTLERWSVAKLAHTDWTAPPGTSQIMAENSRGQILISSLNRTQPFSYRLVLTARLGSAGAAVFEPFAILPRCADISPDGTRIGVGLAPSAREDVFEVWNTVTGRLEFRLFPTPPTLPDTRQTGSCKVRFSPDGQRVATSGATVHVWDVATGAKRASDSQQAGAFRQAIAFNRDGNRLAIGRPSGLVDVLDLSQPSPTLVRLFADERVEEKPIPDADRMVHTFLRSKREVVAVAFSPDDRTILSGTSRTVGIWDIEQSKLVRVLSGHAADVMDVAVSADGRRIYSLDDAGVVRMWLPGSAPAVWRVAGSATSILPFTISADGTVIGTANADGGLTTIRLTDLHQEVIRPGTSESPGGIGDIPPVAISPDGLRIFAAELGGTIRRWTIGAKETVAASLSPSPVLSDFEERSTLIATTLMGRVPTSPGIRVSSLTVSPSGTLLAFTDNRTVAVWDASTMRQLAALAVGSSKFVLFRDEETLIISTALEPHSLIRIWNWRTNRVFGPVEPRLAVGSRGVWRPVLSQGGRRIALILTSFGPSSIVSIWDSDLKKEVGRLPPGDYHALAFSPDGRRIVTVGNEESVVRVWDGDRLLPLLTLFDTDSHFGGVAFTSAGQIVAGRTGGGLTIWETQIRRR
jgi:serine/threonine protein kinase/WD40 repeat protein